MSEGACSTAMSEGQERLAWVDSLRAIAPLLVVISHLPNLTMSHDMIFGTLGVNIFFLISGYVIPISLKAGAHSPIRIFMIRRFWRLYPAYWLSMGLALALGGMAEAPAIAANASMVQRYLGFEDLIPVYWSLSLELAFYGLTVTLFAVGWLQRPRPLTVFTVSAMAATIASAAAAEYLHIRAPAGAMLFLLLMVFGTWLRLGDATGPRKIAMVAAMLLTQIVTCWIFYGNGWRGFTWDNMLAKHALAVALFLLLAQRRFMAFRPLAFVGMVSYPLYLIHYPLAGIIFAPFVQFSPVIGWIAVFAAIIALAAAVHYGVERPFIQVGRYLSRKRKVACAG